jgi:hypothetical protein
VWRARLRDPSAADDAVELLDVEVLDLELVWLLMLRPEMFSSNPSSAAAAKRSASIFSLFARFRPLVIETASANTYFTSFGQHGQEMTRCSLRYAEFEVWTIKQKEHNACVDLFDAGFRPNLATSR